MSWIVLRIAQDSVRSGERCPMLITGRGGHDWNMSRTAVGKTVSVAPALIDTKSVLDLKSFSRTQLYVSIPYPCISTSGVFDAPQARFVNKNAAPRFRIPKTTKQEKKLQKQGCNNPMHTDRGYVLDYTDEFLISRSRSNLLVTHSGPYQSLILALAVRLQRRKVHTFTWQHMNIIYDRQCYDCMYRFRTFTTRDTRLSP